MKFLGPKLDFSQEKNVLSTLNANLGTSGKSQDKDSVELAFSLKRKKNPEIMSSFF